MRRVLAWFSIATMLATLPGCSFIFVRPPPQDHAQLVDFTCTRNQLAPVIDTGFGVMYGLSTLGGALVSGSGQGDASTAGLTLMMLAVTGLFGASAYVGFDRTATCREALDGLHQRRALARRPAPSSQPAPNVVGCASHDQCRFGRICVYGACIDPPPPLEDTPVLLFEGLPSQNAAPTQQTPTLTTP